MAAGGDPQLVVRRGAPGVLSVFFPSSSFHRKEKQRGLRSQDVQLWAEPGREATQKSRTTSGSGPGRSPNALGSAGTKCP